MFILRNLFFKSLMPNSRETNDYAEGSGNRLDILGLKDEDCILSDFSPLMLSMEVMRLGFDPANMTNEEMRTIVLEEMNSHREIMDKETVKNVK